jgi:hypothetical protein
MILWISINSPRQCECRSESFPVKSCYSANGRFISSSAAVELLSVVQHLQLRLDTTVTILAVAFQSPQSSQSSVPSGSPFSGFAKLFTNFFIFKMMTHPACNTLFRSSFVQQACPPRLCSSRRAMLLKPSAAIPSPADISLSDQTARRSMRMPTIQLISSAVAIQAQTQRFERFAGRSAMVSALDSVPEPFTHSDVIAVVLSVWPYLLLTLTSCGAVGCCCRLA